MALFRVDFSGRGELSERQQKVRDILNNCPTELNMNIAEACTSMLKPNPANVSTNYRIDDV